MKNQNEIKKENKLIRNLFLIATLVYWVGAILVSVDTPLIIGVVYIRYVLIVGFFTLFSSMIIKSN